MDNSTRPTKELISGEHKVVIYTYLTGRESNEVKGVLFKGISVSGAQGEKPEIPLINTIPQQRVMLEKLVVSFDAVTDRNAAVDAIEELPSTEYDELVKTIQTEAQVFLAPKK